MEVKPITVEELLRSRLPGLFSCYSEEFNYPPRVAMDLLATYGGLVRIDKIYPRDSELRRLVRDGGLFARAYSKEVQYSDWPSKVVELDIAEFQGKVDWEDFVEDTAALLEELDQRQLAACAAADYQQITGKFLPGLAREMAVLVEGERLVRNRTDIFMSGWRHAQAVLDACKLPLLIPELADTLHKYQWIVERCHDE